MKTKENLLHEEADAEIVQEQFCTNIYLNEIFNNYFRRLKEQDTVLRLDIQTGDEELPYKELCQILSKGMENACNVSIAQAAGERVVSVQMKCSSNCLLLRIKNQCSDNLSAKKEAESGAGLHDLQEFVENMGGVMLCYAESVNSVLDVLVRVKR